MNLDEYHGESLLPGRRSGSPSVAECTIILAKAISRFYTNNHSEGLPQESAYSDRTGPRIPIEVGQWPEWLHVTRQEPFSRMQGLKLCVGRPRYASWFVWHIRAVVHRIGQVFHPRDGRWEFQWMSTA